MSLDWDRFKAAQYAYVSENRSPCTDNYVNQCALRVSNALVAAGWPFNSRGKPYTENRFGPLCNHGRARGAKSLADYLEVYLIKPRRYVRPINPDDGKQNAKVGKYIQDADGNFEFLLFWDYMERQASRGQKLRGIIFFDNPNHIDGFDLSNKINTNGGRHQYPSGIIGESYHTKSTEIRVFFL